MFHLVMTHLWSFMLQLKYLNTKEKEEDKFVSNFFDLNWQNSAVFYAGKSKDMADFLIKINKKLQSAKHINDFFTGVAGAGYLLQALYQQIIKSEKRQL
jgi:hypothetical protein